MSDEWRARLTPAFEALLGAPLSDHPQDATYATFAWGNFLREAGLDRLPAWLDPAALRGDTVLVHQHLAVNDEGPLRVDAAGSLFDIPSADGLLEGRELQLPPAEDWRVAYVRLASDGTLFDAMRAATQVGDGPEDLFEFEFDADEEWEAALAEAGVDDELLAHLRWCCADGTAGMVFNGTGPFKVPRGTVVASWSDEAGFQWDMAVVRL
ncbi:hypothetical protein [Dactylosporangium sp. NPDC050588]|uniref:hypothetical protein n=1 Tax=Dactylosporangium sp. NPDC050588 TaxID=3157211 RepID=UPI0033DD7181